MIRNRLSYANVVSTLALILAVGTGGAWAATTIHGNLIKKNTVTGNKLKKNTLGTREVNEAKLGKVPSAGNADTAGIAASATLAQTASNSDLLGGIGVDGFVRGGGSQTAGRTTGPAGNSPNVIRTFQTPLGEFRLGCGNAAADVRYFNTTPGDADVFRTFVGPTTTNTNYDVEPSGGGTGLGYSAGGGQGPHFVDIRAGKGEQVAILRVGERREGSTCIWNWELITPG
jgi:hypothetical protein